MLDIGGVYYVVDLSAVDKLLTEDISLQAKEAVEKETKEILDEEGKLISTEIFSREYTKPKEIDGPKYDMIRTFFEVVLTYNEELDDDLGVDRALAKTSLPFKLSFNTLLEYGVIKEIE